MAMGGTIIRSKVFDYGRVPSFEATVEFDGRALDVHIEVLGLGMFTDQTPWWVANKEVMEARHKEFMAGLDPNTFIGRLDQEVVSEVTGRVATFLSELASEGIIRRRL